ncbi:MAG TPA: aldose epimerase family protein [Chondromyces sp.]|nr:aldose epimerase family protein [Chondromyces sp.]
MRIEREQVNGKWLLYKLTNDNGMEVHILNFGGIITKIVVPDKEGKLENVVLGYKHYQDYESDASFFGAIIGRVAGRIQNSSFLLGGTKYALLPNEGENHLHGGTYGFHRIIWDSEPFQSDDTVGIKLTYFSSDGEGGYPGNIKAAVSYTLNQKNQLSIDYSATTDQTTVLTMTNHSYFNLSGNLRDTIHNHYVTIDSGCFVELDQHLMPTGRRLNVDRSTFDFRYGRRLGDGIESDSLQNLIAKNGYDHYFLFDQNKYENVIVKEESSGRVLTITTDQPGMVMYTSNNLTEGLQLTEGPSKKHLGVCFETQASPASLHHEGFPSIILEKDEVYKKQTVFSFGVSSTGCR